MPAGSESASPLFTQYLFQIQVTITLPCITEAIWTLRKSLEGQLGLYARLLSLLKQCTCTGVFNKTSSRIKVICETLTKPKKLNQVQTLKTLQESHTIYQPVVIVTGGSLGASFRGPTRVLK